MGNLLKQKQFEKIESEFLLSKSLLSVLFFISFSGIFIGTTGWILSPTFLWRLPDYYYLNITLAAFILLGLALAGKKLTQNLRMAYSELKTIQ
jgi:hypothetical protein